MPDTYSPVEDEIMAECEAIESWTDQRMQLARFSLVSIDESENDFDVATVLP